MNGLPSLLSAARDRLRPHRLRSLSLALLVQLAVLAIGLWAFFELADYVEDGEPHALDRRLLLALRDAGDPSDPIGPLWFEEFVRDVTALGGLGVLALVTAGVAGYLVVAHRRRTAVLLVLSIAGGVALSTAAKALAARPRPDLVPHGMHVYTESFPSGHAMLSAVTYMTLGALLMRVVPDRWERVYVLAFATALTVLVGSSRVYLGVHWPSDVLAGWALGTAWAIATWIATAWLQRRGQVEEEPAPTT